MNCKEYLNFLLNDVLINFSFLKKGKAIKEYCFTKNIHKNILTWFITWSAIPPGRTLFTTSQPPNLIKQPQRNKTTSTQLNSLHLIFLQLPSKFVYYGQFPRIFHNAAKSAHQPRAPLLQRTFHSIVVYLRLSQQSNSVHPLQ